MVQMLKGKGRMKETRVGGTQSISRTIHILRELATADLGGLRVVDLCERLQLEWPTAHRILLCLQQEQMVTHMAESKRYRLGPAVFQLGLAAASQFPLRETCRESLDRLAALTGDTVFLMARSGRNSVVIERREGTFPVKALMLDVGVWRPLGVGAAGLALLAALPEELAREIAHANRERILAYGDFDTDKLLAMVRDSHARGYALDEGYAFPEVTGVGLPVRSVSGLPIAAISVVAIKSRMTNERIKAGVKLLRREIKEIETRLTALST